MNETVECEYVIDTSSLLSLVRYYHPFDKEKPLKYIKQLLTKHKRIALTCFERDYQCCHRSSLIDYYNQHIEKVEDKHL